MDSTIIATRLSIFSHEELSSLAVCEVNVAELEGIGTPNDPRMGVLEDGKLCYTCHKSNIDCSGHLGIINLNRWFLNSKFVEIAIRILMCVCNSCGECLLTEDIIRNEGLLEMSLVSRIKILSEISVKQICSKKYSQPCAINPTYFPSKCKDSHIIICEYDNKGQKIVIEKSIVEIYDILSRISSKSQHLLGFDGKTKPKDFVCRSLPVIPPCARPYVIRDGETSYDYLTTCYIDITRYNNLLQKNKELTEVQKKNIIRNLYFYISHMIDNTDKKYTRSRDEPIQSVIERLTPKTGYIRGSVMGKRVDYSGRLVLNPYNKIRFGEIVYPSSMKYLHTTPINVCSFNLNKIREMYKNGLIMYMTIGNGKLKGNRFKIISSNKERYLPQIGDIIERIAQDGDETLFNRQPTLHKQSIMGYKAKYIDNYNCIGLHSSYTTPHNADFDGDEGNKHKIQTIAARVETRHIADVGSCIMNAQSNRPIIGLVYNTITSAYILTQPDVMIDKELFEEAINLINYSNDKTFEDKSFLSFNKVSQKGDHSIDLSFNKVSQKEDHSIDLPFNKVSQKEDHLDDKSFLSFNKVSQKEDHSIDLSFNSKKLSLLTERLNKWNVKQYSGLALFSILLPNDFYYNSEKVKIRDGILISGPLTKKQLGPVNNSIIHYIWKLYGKERTMQFITEAQWILDWFIEKRGFSIGIKDCIFIDVQKQENVKEIINTEIGYIQNKINKNTQEIEIQGLVNIIKRIGDKISLEALTKNNPLVIMAKSGAKGNESNTAQILGCLGQQYISGKRPELTITKKTRILPYYEPNILKSSENKYDIEANGFIKESFMEGLNPGSMMFHMMASRIGLMDTALKTADTGHMHHRINKTLEDFVYDYDGRVRNTIGTIFQYNYSDGFNAGELISTNSESLGSLISFIDLSSIIGKLNLENGYDYIH